MLEHMMFKGTEKIGPEEFSRIIQANGGNDNAFTSRDYTAYFENLSADRIQVAIDLESDRMQTFFFVRTISYRTDGVMEERRLRTEIALLHFSQTAGSGLPFSSSLTTGRSSAGWRILTDLHLRTEGYYRTYYNPANAFLSLWEISRKRISSLKLKGPFVLSKRGDTQPG